MHRIDTAGHNNNLFIDKDPASGIAGTIVNAEWLNAVQEETCAVIEHAGGTLQKGTNNQLLNKLKTSWVEQIASVTALRAITPEGTRRVYVGAVGAFRAVTGAPVGTYVDDGRDTVVPTGGNGSSAWLRDVGAAAEEALQGDLTNHDDRLSKVIDTGTYDAFGALFPVDADTVLYVTRQGTSHVGDKGVLAKATYTVSTGAWSAFSTIYTDANADYDARNVGGGLIGSDIYVFFARYNKTTSAFVDIGFIKSSDGGATWSAYTAIPVGLTNISPHGHIVQLGLAEFVQPYYGDNGAGTYRVALLRSVDGGATWAAGPVIYSGATAFTEVTVEHLGQGRCIALIRDNAGNGLARSVSADYGATWSAPVATNLGRGICVPASTTDDTLMYVAFAERTSKQLLLAYAKKDDVYSSATCFSFGGTVLDGSGFTGGLLGYPGVVKLADGRFLVVSADNLLGASADTYAGVVRFLGKNGGITSLRRASAQVITPNTDTPIQFDRISADDQAAYDPITYKWTPKVPGWYRVSCALLLEGTGVTGKIAIFKVYINGAEYKRIGSIPLITGLAVYYLSGTGLVYASPGAEFLFEVGHNNTTNLTINPYPHSQYVDIERVR